MTTVIDSLIVELKLDPKGFTDGQKKAAEALRDLERQAARSSAGVSRSGEGAVSFFRQINAPVAALRRQMEILAVSTIAPRRGLTDLAAQGRRTGTAVEAGAAAGALSLRTLGIAGVAAFSVFEGLKKTIDGASHSASTVFGTGVRAGAAGTGIQRFSAISQALRATGNVPEEQTQSWLAEWTQWQNTLKTTGRGTERLAPLTYVGAGIDSLTDTGEQALLKMARAFARMTNDEAITRGRLAGLTDEQSLALKRNGDQLQRNIDLENRRHAITGDDYEAQLKLVDAQSRLAVSWGALTRVLVTDLAPALASIVDSFTNFYDRIKGFVSGEKKTIVIPDPLGIDKSDDYSKKWPWSMWAPFGVPKLPAVSPGQPNASIAGTNSGATPPSGRMNRTISFFEGKGLTHDQAIGMTARLSAESGGLNPNIVNPNSGAYGLAQWLGPRKPAALATGGDFDKQLELIWQELNTTERAALRNIRSTRSAADAARAMESFERAGNPAFTEGAARLADRIASGVTSTSTNTDSQVIRDAIRAHGGRDVWRGHAPPGVKFNSKGEPYSTSLETMSAKEARNVELAMAAIKRGQIYQGKTSDVVHNHGDVNGDIHVHTQATSPDGIADATANSLKKMVSPSNNGLF